MRRIVVWIAVAFSASLVGSPVMVFDAWAVNTPTQQPRSTPIPMLTSPDSETREISFETDWDGKVDFFAMPADVSDLPVFPANTPFPITLDYEPPEPVTITWFVELGTGSYPEQLYKEDEVIARFNASHENIQIEIIEPSSSLGYDVLNALIERGDPPDIVGPVSMDRANQFYGHWLDLDPLVAAFNYDLGQFLPTVVDYYRTGEGLVSLPFSVYPSFIWYRPALFDAAGLAYPPTRVGEPYLLDGREVEWNMATLREISMRLTLDSNGHTAADAEFKADQTVQWGFIFQWFEPRGIPTSFGSGHLYDPITGRAYIPDHWRTGWNWVYDGIWRDHFIPDANEIDDVWPGAFASGRVAMAVTQIWYTWCIEDSDWQAAVLPSYQGTVTATLNTDSFRIMKYTDDPLAAFVVYAYLIGEAAPELIQLYGGMPARLDEIGSYVAVLDDQFPQGVDWSIAIDMLNFLPKPSHDAWLPNHRVASRLLRDFADQYNSTPGLNMNAELDQLVEDLQAVFDAAE